ncbi:hypothetical protein ABFX02_08G187300 [Erythranthe guttata]
MANNDNPRTPYEKCRMNPTCAVCRIEFKFTRDYLIAHFRDCDHLLHSICHDKTVKYAVEADKFNCPVCRREYNHAMLFFYIPPEDEEEAAKELEEAALPENQYDLETSNDSASTETETETETESGSE